MPYAARFDLRRNCLYDKTMLKTCAEIAKLKGVSRQAACKYLKTFSVKPSSKKGRLPAYDTRMEPVASYLGTNNKKTPPAKKNTAPAAAKPNAAMAAAAAKMAKPLNDLLSGKLPPGRTPSANFYMQAMAIAIENKDAALLFKLGACRTCRF